MTELKCTKYLTYDYDDGEQQFPCHCPVCGGFLAWKELEPICNKCGTELLVIPERDEETGEELESGKICPISKPKKEGRKQQ